MKDFEKELGKILQFYNTTLEYSERKDDSEIQVILNNTLLNYNSNNFNFSNYKTIVLNQQGKRRQAKQYDLWSSERFLCTYLKRIIDKTFKLKYANRNEQIHLLFGILSTVQNMRDFVIVKFDFEDFFNSISSEYVYKKFIDNSLLNRELKILFSKFISECKYCYAGLNLSNVFAELISREFDSYIYNTFSENGLIFYKRYVDDGILIFNKHIAKQDCVDGLQKAIQNTFYCQANKIKCKNKTKLNMSKFNYISRRDIIGNQFQIFDYLGYNFTLSLNSSNKLIIKYGITDSKIQKYQLRLKNIVEDYKNSENPNMEILRHRIKAFCCRIVYRRKKQKTLVWKAKGFISNYNELRFHMTQLDDLTKDFLENAVLQAFDSSGVDRPYFIKANSQESIYSLSHTLKKNRTLLFVENDKIGFTKFGLQKKCEQVGIDCEGKSYNIMLGQYLMKLKIGH